MLHQATSPAQAAAGLDGLAGRDLAVLWHPCTQMHDHLEQAPLAIRSAAGCWLETDGGQRVFDVISSWWGKCLGHRHPRVVAALHQQLDRYEQTILAGTTSEATVLLCERLLAAANASQAGHFAKVFFADNGSTGVEVALKLALHAQARRGRAQRSRFACLEGAYHGETAGAMSVSDCALYRQPYGSLLHPAHVIGGLPWRSGPADPRWADASAEWPTIEAQLNRVAGTLAALIVEPVLQGAGGMRLYSPDLLPRLAGWCRANDVLLIADEIAAGWGRLGTMLAWHLAGERAPLPDICVLAKGLTAGAIPQSAVLCTQALYELFWGPYAQGIAFLHSNTHAGNALAVAAALATLDAFAAEGWVVRAAREGATLHTLLAGLAATQPRLGNVRGCGWMAAADLAARPGEVRPAWPVYRQALRRGALWRPLGQTFYLLPPLIATQAELAQAVEVLGEAIAAV